MYLTVFPRDTTDRALFTAEIFEFCQSFHIQGLDTTSFIKIFKIYFFNIHCVILFQYIFSFLHQSCNCPLEHILLASLSYELVLMLYHLCLYMLWPAPLLVVHAGPHYLLGLCIDR